MWMASLRPMPRPSAPQQILPNPPPSPPPQRNSGYSAWRWPEAGHGGLKGQRRAALGQGGNGVGNFQRFLLPPGSTFCDYVGRLGVHIEQEGC